MIYFMENSIILQSPPYCTVTLLIIWEIPDVFVEIKGISPQIKWMLNDVHEQIYQQIE